MGIHTLEIKALKFSFGQIALLTISAVILSGCSSTTPKPDETTAEAQVFEPQAGSIEPVVQQSINYTPQSVSSQNIQLTADHPREYTVKKGDTLWDIASLFLKDPWYWPEIWQRNPQVANPHLIFPGDILMLIYVDGRPQIQLARAEDGVMRRQVGDKVVKLSPSIHRQSLNEAIPSIPGDAVRQFLTRPRIVTAKEWADAPYIVGSDDAHLIMGANNKIYIRGELDKERIRYSIFRRGNRLADPETDELLGHEVIFAGEARIIKYGNPSTGLLLKTSREVLVGDRLLPTDKSAIDQQYFPRLPEDFVQGTVISLFDAISAIAKYQIAVINRGSNDKMEVGHLLASYQAGSYTHDRFLDRSSIKRGDATKLDILLPDERSGIMMLFKVFDKVSYALVLKSTRSIRKGDKVEKPR